MSHTNYYKDLKSSNGVYYIQIPISFRVVKEFIPGNFVSGAYGFYIGKGISKEWKYYDWNNFLSVSYRRKRLETEISFKFQFIDWDSIFVTTITMGEYTDIAFTQTAVFKFNLKYRL